MVGDTQVNALEPQDMLVEQIIYEQEPFGAGGFSDVHLGRWEDPNRSQQLAVKCFRHVTNHNRGEMARTMNRRLRTEIQTWRQAQVHPNILPFLGVYLRAAPSLPALVSPYRPAGNIISFLDNFDANRKELSVGIASGLAHLHQHDIVHGDLTPNNILIHHDDDGNIVPQISDFGRAKILNTKGFTGSLNTTQAYTPLEVLLGSNPSPENSIVGLPPGGGNQVLTKMSDVYSLGMVLLHIVSGTGPYPGLNYAQIVLALDKRQGPKINVHGGKQVVGWIWPLLQRCWAFGAAPIERCTARECLGDLSRLLEAEGGDLSQSQFLDPENTGVVQN